MNELTVELFAPGKWNDMHFDSDDLKDMVKNFELLKEFQFAPVKLGHNEKQEMTDGLPSLGEIVDVWYSDKGKDGKPKLMGKLVGMPNVVFKAISKKLYKKLSIELDIGVQHKGRFMKYVLTGVALLGADIPAVNTLSDLDAYMSKKKELFTDSKTKVHFTQDLSFNIEDKNMDYQKMYEDLQTKFSKLQADLATVTAENTTLKSDKAEFSRKEKEREETEKKNAIETARKDVNATFEKAVSDELITPAQRDHFSKLLNVDDDDAVVKISTKDIESLLESTSGKMFSKSQAKSGDNKKRSSEDAGVELDVEANRLMNEPGNSNLSYAAAFSRVMKANPELAKEHLANQQH